jgi:5-methylcytosine-specific restriction protein B
MATQFSWVPFYGELAHTLLAWEGRQPELIAFLEELRKQGLVITPLNDRDEQGARFLVREIDPFTFFGVFNRGIRNDQRLGILQAIKRKFSINAPIPEDFSGVVNNQRSWFFSYQDERRPDDVSKLWQVFRLAQDERPLDNPQFLAALDGALEIQGVSFNLTMGLFWIRPDTFLNLDHVNREFLHLKIPSGGLTSAFYADTLRSIASTHPSLPALSKQAWDKASELSSEPSEEPIGTSGKLPDDVTFWMLGAYWSDRDPADQTQRFQDEGIWQNGYEDRYLDEVRSIRPGDRIAIKATSTQRHDLPFDSRNHTVSKMTIKAVGTVTKNPGNGRTIEVEWESNFKPRDWYFYTYQPTVWRLRPNEEMARRLVRFAFNGEQQDYAWFCERWWGSESVVTGGIPIDGQADVVQPYDVADLIGSGVFLSEEDVKLAIDRLSSKKNLILQGPPGVGKTYIARKLAFVLMKASDNQRIQMVQFHQSYSYEDFIRGYRPLPEKAGAFALQDGIFFEFCHRAAQDPDRPYVFIIDEINRGNLSQIFGELLMLIEADKRGPAFQLPLVYRRPDEAPFNVPLNLYIIGLMNVADRSLAMVDYALRRRFAFFSLVPQYDSDRFQEWLLDRGMQKSLVELIVGRMSALNKQIAGDPLLGHNYQLGHSFFCPKGDNFAELDRNWYEGIVLTEVLPLLAEYWFDNATKVDEIRAQLLAP